MKTLKKVDHWKKIHTYQEKPGWCGPAVIQMLLKAAKMKITQSKIAKDTYVSWFGTSQDILYAYLTRYFRKVGFDTDCSLKDLKAKIDKGNLVVVDWWDNLDTDNPDGHYTVAVSYNDDKKNIKMLDPSTEREGIWNMNYKDFNSRWYDSLDVNGKNWINGWMLWVNPELKFK